MNRTEITNKVYEAIRETLNKKDLEISLTSNIIDDLGMDSIDGMALLIELEELFDIKLSDEEVNNFTTVDFIVDYIESLEKNI